ncbi:MAG: PQQ-binding-like beta-propeller repeat protein [Alphaproteobacteria bacterium]|nr:PQQ-binding-like beta-propeller repeat protein [Alphaproteobacteria bacterium]
MRTNELLALLAVAFILSGCDTVGGWMDSDDSKKEPLKGERIAILQAPQIDTRVATNADNLAAINLPSPWRNDYWPQAGGYPSHVMNNVKLASALKESWSTSIGEGRQKNIPLVNAPVVFEGKIFTLDTDAEVRAFAIEDGKKIWAAETRPEGEDEAVIPGGIAYASGRIFVTSGYSEVLSMDAKTGKILWRHALPAPSRSAPTVADDRVYVVTIDNRLQTLSASSGQLQWEYQGIMEAAGVIGGASPAVDGGLVVAAFSSGELVALQTQNGAVAWADTLAPVTKIGGLASLSDIRALPVIEGGTVYAISFGGKLVAIDARGGSRIWARDLGGVETPYIAGNMLFVLTKDNSLLAIDRATGAIRWTLSLPDYTDKDRKKPIVFKGPVLAGDRLLLANSEGEVWEVGVMDGKALRQWDAGSAISVPLIVAAETLYLLNDKGTLTAYK